MDAVTKTSDGDVGTGAAAANATGKRTRKPRTTGALLAMRDDNATQTVVELPSVFTAVNQLQKHLDETVADDDTAPIRVYRYIGTYTKKVKRRVASAIK